MEAYGRIKLARRMDRATAVDYIEQVFDNFTELHGDRYFGDDHAIVGGIAWLDDMPVTVIGIEKGHTVEEKMDRNFGCAMPEGYRKAQRLIKEAEKFKRPVVCFVDTQGANPGSGAEMRGQGEAIADNLYELMTVDTPIISVMIGEGGSGGALALAVADEVWMLENAYYSVASPEAVASILFKDSAKVNDAVGSLKLFAEDLLELGVIERVISEPTDFTDKSQTDRLMAGLKTDIENKLAKLNRTPSKKLLADRYEKYRKIGRQEHIK